MTLDHQLPVVAVIGGSGKEGRGLAYRLARAGYPVIIGSRSSERAELAAEELQLLLTQVHVRGEANLEAAQHAAIVVITVPSDAHLTILESIQDSPARPAAY